MLFFCCCFLKRSVLCNQIVHQLFCDYKSSGIPAWLTYIHSLVYLLKEKQINAVESFVKVCPLRKVLVKVVTRLVRDLVLMKKREKKDVSCDELYERTQQYGELVGWQPVPSVFLSHCLFRRLFSSFSSAAFIGLQLRIFLNYWLI